MTSLLHFEETVHRKDLARVETFPLLMSRLLSQVLEHLGFPEEPHIEWRISCTQVLSTERSLYMSISIILQQQEKATDDVAEDPPRGEHPVPEMEVEVERAQFKIHLLQLHLLLPQPLLTLMALPIQHSSLQSISMSFLGS